MEELLRFDMQRSSDVHLVCSKCKLLCIFGNFFECKTCDVLTLCFKRERSRVFLHTDHDLQVTERDESWTRKTLSPVKGLNHWDEKERQKYRRELELDV
jgi:hypothetical protein